MSLYTITNNTNSRTNTLANALAPGAVSVTGYNQGGASITSTLLLDTTIEPTTTGYKSSGTDIGNSYCAMYDGSTGTRSIPVANYSSCTLVMCGAGGGGGGSRGSLTPSTAGPGGDGGIDIITPRIPLSGVSTINVTIGTGGARGLGAQYTTIPPRAATAGSAGNATTVTISPTISYTANAGNGGGTTPSPAATNGNITPAPMAPLGGLTRNLNGPLKYNGPVRVITLGGATYGQGGAGGNLNPAGNANNGNNGVVGYNGYVRVYLYP
jgi:hypothetical protein